MCQDNLHFLFLLTMYAQNLPWMSPLQSLSSPRGSGSIREESSAAGSGVLCGEVSSGQWGAGHWGRQVLTSMRIFILNNNCLCIITDFDSLYKYYRFSREIGSTFMSALGAVKKESKWRRKSSFRRMKQTRNWICHFFSTQFHISNFTFHVGFHVWFLYPLSQWI